MKWVTPERIVLYLSILCAMIGGVWAFNTRYMSLIHADEILIKDVNEVKERVTELEKIDKKIDKIYDYVVKQGSN